MRNGWEDIPDWQQIAADWERELGYAGITAYGVVASIDVVVDDPADLVDFADQPGAWLPRASVHGLKSMEIAEIRAIRALAMSGPSANELATFLARAAGDRDVVAALMIRATMLAYWIESRDPLWKIGELAAARLLAASMVLSQQGRRPTFLLQDRLPDGPNQYAHIVAALAREHAEILRRLQPMRFRPLLRQTSAAREVSVEETRSGLIIELSRIAGDKITTVMEVEGPTILGPDGRPVPERYLRAANDTTERAILSAIIDAAFEASRWPEQYMKEGTEYDLLAWYPPFLTTLVDTNEQGHTVRLQRPPSIIPTKDEEYMVYVHIRPNGTMAERDRAEVARFLDLADLMDSLFREAANHIDDWERVGHRKLRISPLTSRLLELSGLNPVDDVEYRWGPHEHTRAADDLPYSRQWSRNEQGIKNRRVGKPSGNAEQTYGPDAARTRSIGRGSDPMRGSAEERASIESPSALNIRHIFLGRPRKASS